MNFITVKTYEELSLRAANLIKAQVLLKPDCVLGLATGSSPVGVYRKLIEWYKNGELDFSKVRTVNLDEYVGLDVSNDQSYRYFMDHNFFNYININKKNTYIPNGCAADLKAEAERYDRQIKSLGGIDMQLLGIGLDGHIGFNEPDDCFTKATRVVDLHESTIEANSRFFSSINEVPRKAITVGIGAIMSAKRVVLIANGKQKAEIVKKAFFGEVTPWIQASILQLHTDVTVIYSEN